MHHLLPFVLVLAEQAPEPEEVKAGWTAFAIFLLLFLAVGLLGWSLTRQLRKVDRAKDAGVLPSKKDEEAARQAARREQAEQSRQAEQSQQAEQQDQPGE